MSVIYSDGGIVIKKYNLCISSEHIIEQGVEVPRFHDIPHYMYYVEYNGKVIFSFTDFNYYDNYKHMKLNENIPDGIPENFKRACEKFSEYLCSSGDESKIKVKELLDSIRQSLHPR